MSTKEEEVVKDDKRRPTPPLRLPNQIVTDDVMIEKYAKGTETTAYEIRSRVAVALASNEKHDPDLWARRFSDAMDEGFIPAGRILSAAGTNLSATLINCFVQPVGDHIHGVEEEVPGIFDACTQSAETMRRGGGVGYDFSSIRPNGAAVKGTGSMASGPISYMHVFDRMCMTVSSAGSRRGAQMGVLRIDHPDVESFIHEKSNEGSLTQFNVSVAVTDEFMEALKTGEDFELVHDAEPGKDLIDAGAYCRSSDNKWVYKTVDPRELWDSIMRNTYDYAEPGILFVDSANKDNNLHYAETFSATNPCAEQWLPPYGCCCLGSINLTRFVKNPFTDLATFDFDAFRANVSVAIRMLDNVLDVTYWPLDKQRQEAMSKRRVGLGFTGLGDALLMLKLRYNSGEGLQAARQIAENMRDAAYKASIDLAKERGAFPLFDADRYLESGFAKRLPKEIQEAIRKHGIRNSHLISIAPTGTISLAFADNASNGIEPAFSWFYTRRKRTADDGVKEYSVVDHAFRRFFVQTKQVDPCDLSAEELAAHSDELPNYFVNALEISATDHLNMVAAVQPYVDSSISKTVNVPADYAYEDFIDLYSEAHRLGLKGLATYRPSDVRGAVLTTESTKPEEPTAPDLVLDQPDTDRRMIVDKLPEPILESLRWPKRPKLPNGNPAHTYMVKSDDYSFAIFVGYTQNGVNHPFEVWVNGSEQPRGLGAIAKALSMDLRSADRSFVKAKLDSLEKVVADDGFDLEMPPDGTVVRVPSLVSGFAKLLKHCINDLEDNPPSIKVGETGPRDLIGHSMTPMMDALMSAKEPKTDADGTMSWSVDIKNHATGDDFVLFVKEVVMSDGQRRPLSVWMSGHYPRVFDGLCKVLSYDMRIVDPAWIGEKLRSLFDFAEPMGDFFAPVPGSKKQCNYPSTVAYVARLLAHRYAMLGILDDEAFPINEVGLMDEDYKNVVRLRNDGLETPTVTGSLCPECSTFNLQKRDGCETCSHCGYTGNCS